MKKSVLFLAASLCACGAVADTPWLFKAGISQVRPSDTTIDGDKFSVSNEVNVTPAIEYTFAPNLSAELLLAIPFKHDVEVNGTKAATFKHLPPTVTLKYSGPEMSGFTPYVGAGL
ncbi:MAG: OmpW family outer membrane protein, partial [Pseudomonadota bacterium]|nr:OmpW family outer membrane protein [Pseudomonadota bacterium]